jgi:pyruvyltransferase
MRNLRTENEIIANWKGEIDKPVVSISCNTYNHEFYIEDALQGFLIQETNFPFEILIHDDASTDRTPEIIRKYEAKYPRLIKPIYQTENQFSKGEVLNRFNFKKAKGEYIALCHGDDYWINKLKLEKQVSVMNNMEVGICGHPAKEVDVEGKDLKKLTGYQVSTTTKIDPKELIRKNGNMLPFGSIMITRDAKEYMLASMPHVRFHSGLQMLCAFRGGIAVMPDVMLAYRTGVPGSTTEIMLGNRARKLETTKKRIISIKYLKGMYGDSYSCVFDKFLAKQVIPLIAFGLESEFKFGQVLRVVLKSESLISQCRILLMIVFQVASSIFFKVVKSIINYFLRFKCLRSISSIKGKLKKILVYLYESIVLRPFNRNAIPVRLFSARKNVGDAINLYLLAKVSGRDVIEVKSGSHRHVLGIGSIIHFGSNKSVVWGSGVIEKNRLPSLSVLKRMKFSAVRGKRTRDLLGSILGRTLNCPLGDPAVLLPLYYTPKPQKQYRLGIVPHYIDKQEVSFKNLLASTNAKVIDVELPVEEFLNELTECEVILSSSLHGLILSDSYNIPNVWVRFSDKIIGGDFKFLDYYSTTDIKNASPVDIRRLSFASDEVVEIVSGGKVAHFVEDKQLLLKSFPEGL